MKILIGMNLPPRWMEVFAEADWEAVHWSQIGAPTASDREIMTWAKDNSYIVFTHDLDFSALLAATQGEGPSVIQPIQRQKIHLSERSRGK
jgi:predicted nuclease of predicted toxin-antitoxin system